MCCRRGIAAGEDAGRSLAHRDRASGAVALWGRAVGGVTRARRSHPHCWQAAAVGGSLAFRDPRLRDRRQRHFGRVLPTAFLAVDAVSRPLAREDRGPGSVAGDRTKSHCFADAIEAFAVLDVGLVVTCALPGGRRFVCRHDNDWRSRRAASSPPGSRQGQDRPPHPTHGSFAKSLVDLVEPPPYPPRGRPALAAPSPAAALGPVAQHEPGGDVCCRVGAAGGDGGDSLARRAPMLARSSTVSLRAPPARCLPRRGRRLRATWQRGSCARRPCEVPLLCPRGRGLPPCSA